MKHVYVIGKGDDAFKVGISANPSKRLEALQTAHHATLRLIGTTDAIADAPLVERRLHTHLTRFHASGEWFNCQLADITTAFESEGATLTLTSAAAPTVLDAAYTPEAFERWVAEMRKRPDIHSEASIARLLGVSDKELAYFRVYGADRRTALACRALFHHFEPWS